MIPKINFEELSAEDMDKLKKRLITFENEKKNKKVKSLRPLIKAEKLTELYSKLIEISEKPISGTTSVKICGGTFWEWGSDDISDGCLSIDVYDDMIDFDELAKSSKEFQKVFKERQKEVKNLAKEIDKKIKVIEKMGFTVRDIWDEIRHDW